MMRKLMLGTVAAFAITVADGAPPAAAQAGTEATGQTTPTPGITARFNGRYRIFFGWVDESPGSFNNNLPAPDNVQANQSSIDFSDYGRLFTGFDGVAANGLRYGATLEIRMGSGGNTRGDTRSGLFFRRSWGYVGMPTLGQIRVGSGPTGAVETMRVGHIDGFGSGGWDGDVPGFLIGANTANTFWYSSSSRNNYTKVGYFSPQFFGFDLGLSYGPNDGNFGMDSSCSFANFSSATGSNACDRIDGTTNQAGLLRAQDIFEVMLRYRGTFGPVGLAVSGGYVGSGTVDNLNPGGISAEGLSVGLGGATVSWAGLTVGGIISGGRANLGTQSLNATGDVVNAPTTVTTTFAAGSLAPRFDVPGGDNSDLFTWSIGATYTAGPYVFGGHYFSQESAGHQAGNTGKREGEGIALGITWNMAPGLAMFLEYLWGEVKERNFDFVAGTAGSGANNKVDAQIVSLGFSFQW